MNRLLLSLSISLSVLSVTGAIGQTWTPLKNPAGFAANNPMLLFDGTLLVQDGDGNDWYRFYPDNTGSYVNGTWKTLPTTGNYSPLYYASQVMPDGRVFIEGGEYDGANNGFTNQGVIFNPATNTFTTLTPPSGWSGIGDMASIVLPNGEVMVSQPGSTESALFNPVTNSFTVPYGTGVSEYNDEEGLTLLPNGKVFKISCWESQQAFLFDPTTAVWTNAASTPYNIVDVPDAEIGPAVVRTDGTVICFGGNGANATYHPTTNTWTSAPSFPSSNGTQLECADAGAVLLPSGNVLVQTGPGYTGAGAKYFEYNGTSLIPVPDAPNAGGQPGYTGNFLMLPTGQAFYTSISSDIYIYTPTGAANPAWAPTITSFPTLIKGGASQYVITGTQLTGLSGCSSYGDDEQNETNYPLIRVRNNATGHVFYMSQSKLSTRAIATGSAIESCNFAVPLGTELGPSTLQVITNGIASASKAVTIIAPVQAAAVSVYQGNGFTGSLASIWYLDGVSYSTHSIEASAGQCAAIEADYMFPTSSINGLSIATTATAQLGVTGQIYAYDYSKTSPNYNKFVLLDTFAFGTGATSQNITITNNGGQYISSTGQVRIVVRGVMPSHISTAIYKLGLDVINVTTQ